MPLNGFNTGRDVTLTLTLPNGTVSTASVTKFSSKPVTKKSRIVPLSGKVTNLVFPIGWEGSFMFDRNTPQLDNFWAAFEQAFNAGGAIPSGYLTETINETDGTVSQYRYTGVQIILDDAGTWEGDDTVKQSLDFVASTRELL